MKGAPWVTGRGLSAPMRRFLTGASALSPRARIWFMSGVRPDLAQLYPARLYSTAVWQDRLAIQIHYRSSMVMSAKSRGRRRSSSRHNWFATEAGDQPPKGDSSIGGLVLAAATSCGRGQRERERERTDTGPATRVCLPRALPFSGTRISPFPAQS